MTTADAAAWADEIALGLMDEDEAARRMDVDPALAREVGAARDRLLPLDLAVEPLEPAPGSWDAIAARLAAAPRARAAPPVPPTSSPVPANVDRAPRGLLAGLLAVAAALFLALLLAPVLRGPADPLAVAVLQDEGGAALALIEDFGGGAVEVTPLTAVTVSATETLQVWTKWSEEAGPVSVGLLDGFAQADLDASLPDPVAGQLYEITREPPGGSPTGLPTGPILAKGLAAALDG